MKSFVIPIIYLDFSLEVDNILDISLTNNLSRSFLTILFNPTDSYLIDLVRKPDDTFEWGDGTAFPKAFEDNYFNDDRSPKPSKNQLVKNQNIKGAYSSKRPLCQGNDGSSTW